MTSSPDVTRRKLSAAMISPVVVVAVDVVVIGLGIGFSLAGEVLVVEESFCQVTVALVVGRFVAVDLETVAVVKVGFVLGAVVRCAVDLVGFVVGLVIDVRRILRVVFWGVAVAGLDLVDEAGFVDGIEVVVVGVWLAILVVAGVSEVIVMEDGLVGFIVWIVVWRTSSVGFSSISKLEEKVGVLSETYK